MDSKKTILTYSLLTFLIVLTDFITKELFKNKNTIIIPNILEINYTKNYGLIYGFFKNNNFFTIILPMIILIIFAYYFFYKSNNKKYLLPATLVIAGILGNLISRIKYGYVIDFIYVPFLQPIFPNFNIADMSSFFGVLLLATYLIKEK
ncbi:signal peptidase II [Candidatus Woesearchaeota archaeon]|nr:signal peptidase II [Candidatus Woesearchaeota archaeon]